MKLQKDGDMEVCKNETVCVEITATDTAFIASTGPIVAGKWAKVTHPSNVKEIRCFKVTKDFSDNFSFTTGFDFTLDNTGKINPAAQYTIRISGNGKCDYVRKRVIRPTKILPTTRVFAFEVGQG